MTSCWVRLIGAMRLRVMSNVIVDEVYGWAQGYTGARFHACLCDPPYELGFMGKAWDRSGVAFRAETWAALSDCLLPGAMLMAFGGTRTWHRLACAIEDAGFEIRDTIMWVYGSGFPKSHDVSKAIDKAAGASREVTGGYLHCGTRQGGMKGEDMGQIWHDETAPATEAAKQWDGYGTALKPAWEPVIVARKRLGGTVAENCVEYGSGALWIEGGRVEGVLEGDPNRFAKTDGGDFAAFSKSPPIVRQAGRWPANVIHDGSEEVVGLFPETKSGEKLTTHQRNVPRLGVNSYGDGYGGQTPRDWLGDSGSAARFFYCAKASKSEREAGCEGMEGNQRDESRNADQPSMNGGGENPYNRGAIVVHNNHPTVKPVALTEYLAKLILPPIAYAPRRLLVPFCGSGSEMIGGHKAGWEEVVGVEMNAEYVEIAEARLRHWTRQMVMGI